MIRMFQERVGIIGVRARPVTTAVAAALGLVATAVPALAAQRPPRPADGPPPPDPRVEEEYLPAAAPAAEEIEEDVQEEVDRALAEAGPALRMLGRWSDGAWLGVRIEEIGEDADTAGAYGARVAGVEDDSPAKRAGLQESDVIVSFQGQRVESARALQRMVSETPAGRTVRLGIRRGGSEREVQVKLEERTFGGHPWGGPRGHGFRFEAPLLPDAPGADRMMRHSWEWPSRPRLGVQVEGLTPQLARYFGVEGGAGVLVEEVRAGSAAERAGLKAGDVILEVNGAEVSDGAALSEALAEAEEGKVTLTIVRERARRTLEATLDRQEGRPRARAPRPGRPAPPPPPSASDGEKGDSI